MNRLTKLIGIGAISLASIVGGCSSALHKFDLPNSKYEKFEDCEHPYLRMNLEEKIKKLKRGGITFSLVSIKQLCEEQKGQYSKLVQKYDSREETDYILVAFDANKKMIGKYSIELNLFQQENPGGHYQLYPLHTGNVTVSCIIPNDRKVRLIEMYTTGRHEAELRKKTIEEMAEYGINPIIIFLLKIGLLEPL